MQAGGGSVRYSPQPNPPDRLTILFRGNPDQRFPPQSATCRPGRRTANKSLVHFHGAKETLSPWTNLANRTWFPVGTNTLTSGSSYFSDPKWTNCIRRFYRLRSP